MQGYAYILTHPGIPAIFYDHFYDWGDSIHDQIVKLVFDAILIELNFLIRANLS